MQWERESQKSKMIWILHSYNIIQIIKLLLYKCMHVYFSRCKRFAFIYRFTWPGLIGMFPWKHVNLSNACVWTVDIHINKQYIILSLHPTHFMSISGNVFFSSEYRRQRPKWTLLWTIFIHWNNSWLKPYNFLLYTSTSMHVSYHFMQLTYVQGMCVEKYL